MKYDNNTPILDKLFPMSSLKEGASELQFLKQDLRGARMLIEKYEKATKGIINKSNCGCISLNGILIKWCGDHF